MSLDQAYQELINRIDSAIRDLLFMRVQWGRREIELIATMISRMARRMERRKDEIDFKVKRIWSPYLVTTRWGIEPPEIEKPCIRLEYPGKQDPSWYDTVTVLRSIDGTENKVVQIPRVPFWDELVTDPKIRSGRYTYLLSLFNFIEVVVDKDLEYDEIISANATVNVSNEGGRPSIKIIPMYALTTYIWSDETCVVEDHSNECYKVPDVVSIGQPYFTMVRLNKKESYMAMPFEISFKYSGSVVLGIYGVVGIVGGEMYVAKYFPSGLGSLSPQCVREGGIVGVMLMITPGAKAASVVLSIGNYPLTPVYQRDTNTWLFAGAIVGYRDGYKYVVSYVPMQHVSLSS